MTRISPLGNQLGHDLAFLRPIPSSGTVASTGPSQQFTIPIVETSHTFKIPKKYHVTYAPGAEIVKEDDYYLVTWTDAEAMELEYSILPFPTMSFRAVNMFWILIIVLLVAPMVFLQVRKRLRKEPTYATV